MTELAPIPPWVLLAQLGLLAVLVLFIRTVATTLRLTAAHHGAGSGIAWLLLVPYFNLGWWFYLLGLATRGIKGRSAELGLPAGDGGWRLGLVTGLLLCATTLLAYVDVEFAGVPLLEALLLAGLAGWLACWWQLAACNRAMAAASAG